MKLYWFWSFNPQKVRLALLELGLPHELVEVDLAQGEQHTGEVAILNPNHKVPVLVDDGIALWESNAILTHLGERERRLWPQDPKGRGEAMQWLFFEARHLSAPIGALWFNDYAAPLRSRTVDQQARQNAEMGLPHPLRVLERRLASNDWLLGAEFTLVDCCYAPLLDALSLSRFDLSGYPAVRAYLDEARTRAAWELCGFRT